MLINVRQTGPGSIEVLRALMACETMLGKTWVASLSSGCVLLTFRFRLLAVLSAVCMIVFKNFKEVATSNF